MRRSCWACWEEKDPPELAVFAPSCALPARLRELAEEADVRPMLCTSCLLAGVTLRRSEEARGGAR